MFTVLLAARIDGRAMHKGIGGVNRRLYNMRADMNDRFRAAKARISVNDLGAKRKRIRNPKRS
jgi:hypothetical protein